MTLKQERQRQALLFAEQQRQIRMERLRQLDEAYEQSRPKQDEGELVPVLVRVREGDKTTQTL